MKLFSSLTNRIFLASALLAVVMIGIAIAIVNARVTREAEGELQRGLEEAGRLVDQHHEMQVETSLRMARLVADLPKLKAAVDLADPPTVEPLAKEYQEQIGSALVVVTHRSGRVLAHGGALDRETASLPALPGIRDALAGRETSAFWPASSGILEVVTVPIFIGRNPPEILGTLSVGFSFDDSLAQRFKALTESEIVFALDGRIQAATLPRTQFPSLGGLLASPGTSRIRLGLDDYLALARPLASVAQGENPVSDHTRAPIALILRSRTERLSFLAPLHRALLGTAVVAIVLATLLSYAVARTVTRPLRAITATMSEMAATGDLTRKARIPAPGRWQDEDARLLATTFSLMTDAIGRFQREAGQRERLASLGRLSTVLAHEVRNPLMIIKAAVRTLRQQGAPEAERREAVGDIDGEVERLDRLVDGVLEFARPIRFEYAPADVNELCRAAAIAAMAGATSGEASVKLDSGLPRITTDAERLHGVLVNLLTNARHALNARGTVPGGPSTADGPPDIELITERSDGGRILIVVRDRGAGIAAEDLPRVWEPYFTTKRGGTGLGLAIAKNVVEGLGGAISIESRRDVGTDVRIELPERAPTGHAREEDRA